MIHKIIWNLHIGLLHVLIKGSIPIFIKCYYCSNLIACLDLRLCFIFFFYNVKTTFTSWPRIKMLSTFSSPKTNTFNLRRHNYANTRLTFYFFFILLIWIWAFRNAKWFGWPLVRTTYVHIRHNYANTRLTYLNCVVCHHNYVPYWPELVANKRYSAAD